MTPDVAEAVGRSRRELLIALAVMTPVVAFVGTTAVSGADDDGAFMAVSRIITGTDRLSPEIGGRIETLLAGRIEDFGSKVATLGAALTQAGASRDALLAGLSDDQVTTALVIARPWYVGLVGTPSDTILKDDAAFATFLQAQSFEKIIDVVPRPSYPGGSAGWWGGAPPGVTAPAMPAEILSWTFQAPGPPRPRAPDPRWRSYAAATFTTVDDARKARP